MALTEGKYAAARERAEKMKIVLDLLKDGGKMEGYHYLIGLSSLKEQKWQEQQITLTKPTCSLLHKISAGQGFMTAWGIKEITGLLHRGEQLQFQ